MSDCLLLLTSLSVSAVGFVFTVEQVKIQCDSGGQVYNLGDYSIGHCEGKISYEHVSSFVKKQPSSNFKVCHPRCVCN